MLCLDNVAVLPAGLDFDVIAVTSISIGLLTSIKLLVNLTKIND